MKPIEVFVPISRVDTENRVVEGYAFVNEVVDGEGGLRLKRSAMEKATPDYEKYGNIREMHQPKAVGTCKGEVTRAVGDPITLGVAWDDKGAFMRAKIVDDDAWKKVEQGVLQGFSIGFKPTKMTGKTVERGTWFETSIVDRPKDPDSNIAIARMEAADDIEVDVDRDDEELRGAFSEQIANSEPSRLRSNAIDTLGSVLYDVHWSSGLKPEERLAKMNDALKEFKAYATPHFNRAAGVAPDSEFIALAEEQPASLARIERGAALPAGDEFIISRADYEEVNRTLTQQAADIEKYKTTPVRTVKRWTEGFDKDKLIADLNEPSERDKKVSELRAAYQQAKEDTTQSMEIARGMFVIKQQLSALGEDTSNL